MGELVLVNRCKSRGTACQAECKTAQIGIAGHLIPIGDFCKPPLAGSYVCRYFVMVAIQDYCKGRTAADGPHQLLANLLGTRGGQICRFNPGPIRAGEVAIQEAQNTLSDMIAPVGG